MGRLADGLAVLAELVRIAYEKEIRYPAAALAYYAFVSFVPLLLLVFAAIGERAATELALVVPRFLTPSVQRLVGRSLATATGQTGAVVVAVLVLAWSGVNVVGDVRAVVRRIEGPTETSLRARTRDAVGILGGLTVAIVAIVTTTVLVGFPGANPLAGLAGAVGLWLALIVAFVPLYYLPSTVVASPLQAVPGATVAALGWTVLHLVVQFYVGNAGRYAVYGVLSSVIVILTSLYLAAAVLLSGIIVNAWVTPGSGVGDG